MMLMERSWKPYLNLNIPVWADVLLMTSSGGMTSSSVAERRLEEEGGAISTVLGLYGKKKEAESIVMYMKEFLVKCWMKRSRVQEGRN